MNTLALAAKFLGDRYCADKQGIWKGTDSPAWASQMVRLSDAALAKEDGRE